MVYLASPFFNEFEEKVKEDMIERVRKDFPTEKLFNPEDSEVSESYGIGGSGVETNKRYMFAKAIFNDNVNGIDRSNMLVFPKYTTDLGTLWEVGNAIGKNKEIYRYNFLTQKLEKVEYEPICWKDSINCDRVISLTFDAVVFGILSSNESIAPNLVYSFGEYTNLKDNLMFAANFKFKDEFGNISTPEERNWEGGIL